MLAEGLIGNIPTSITMSVVIQLSSIVLNCSDGHVTRLAFGAPGLLHQDNIAVGATWRTRGEVRKYLSLAVIARW